MTPSTNFIAWLRLYCRCVPVTKVWQLYHFNERSYHNLNLIGNWPENSTFFERPYWFKVNNLGLALDMALKFYANVAKRLKLKIRKWWGLIPKFVEGSTGEKLLVGAFRSLPRLERVKLKLKAQKCTYTFAYIYIQKCKLNIYICTTWKFKNVNLNSQLHSGFYFIVI